MRTALETLHNQELLTRTHDLIRRGNAVEAELLAHLGEVDARKLYLERAFPSMFVFCLRELHFSEPVAYKRICAARTARRHPEILAALSRGELHLTAVTLLAPQLSEENSAALIRAARHKSADEIRRLLADRKPKPSVPASMRRIPESRTSLRSPALECTPSAGVDGAITPPAGQSAPTAQASPSVQDEDESECGSVAGEARTGPASPRETWRQRSRSEPLGGERYCVRFTADAALHAQLQELLALMRHQIPHGDLGKILARAVPLLLEKVRKRKFGECAAPKSSEPMSRPASRSIPAATRRSVTQRDAERCTFVSPDGRRCGSREFLEFHHRDPWAQTKAHPPGGITLFCRAHNQHQAGRDFGVAHMARFRRQPAAPGSEEPERERNLGTDSIAQLDLNPVATSEAVPAPRSESATRQNINTKQGDVPSRFTPDGDRRAGREP